MASSVYDRSSTFLYESARDEINFAEIQREEDSEKFQQFIRYLFTSAIIFIALFLLIIIMFLIKRGQKTRNPQQRRPYINTRVRQSLTPQEPTVYVSPANLPPPPKYEAMAPPSYDEVVGIHYPGYQPPGQPITMPITTAMAQNTTGHSSNNNINTAQTQTTVVPSTVVTVATDNRTSVTVATT